MNMSTTITVGDATYELDVELDVEYERGGRHMPSGVCDYEVTSAYGYEYIDGDERELSPAEAAQIAQEYINPDDIADAYEDEEASYRYDAEEARYDAMKCGDYY